MLREADNAAGRVDLGSSVLGGTETQLDAGWGDVVVHDTHLLFQGEYSRVGLDLVIRDDGNRLTVHDYFRPGRHPNLVSEGGASLSGEVVEALALSSHGPRYAQAGTVPATPTIGRVETVGGTASVLRNGSAVTLNVGDLVYRGDVVQTGGGSSLGIVFIDGTAFSLLSGARMVLNDMIYSPGGTGNSALLSLVQGSISFVAGQVAKTGDMRVDTPVATMGIRGTAVNVDISADNGTTRFSVMREPDGRVGSYVLYSKTDPNVVLANVSQVDVGVVIEANGTVTSFTKSAGDIGAEQLIVQVVFQLFNAGQANPIVVTPAPGPSPPQGGPRGGGGGGSSTPPDGGAGNGSSGPTSPQLPAPVNPPGPDNTAPGPAIPGAPPTAGQSGGGTNQQTSNTAAGQTNIGGSGEATANASGTSASGDAANAAGATAAGPPTTAAAGATTAPLGASNATGTAPSSQGSSGTSDATSTPAGQTSQTSAAQTSPAQTGTPAPFTPKIVSVAADSLVLASNGHDGVLAREGASDALIATEHVVSAHGAAGTEVAVGSSPTTVTGTYGTLAIQSDGSYSYLALRATALAKGETGDDVFTFTVQEADGNQTASTLTFHVVGVNDAPIATPDRASVDLSAGTAVDAASRGAGVLANDTDPDHGETAALAVSAVHAQGAPDTAVAQGAPATIAGRYGTLTVAADGTYHYVADHAQSLGAGRIGDDVFIDTIADPNGATSSASLTFSVTGVNDAPVARDQSASLAQNVPADIAPAASDVDTTDTLTYRVTTAPQHGSVTFGSGAFHYTPTTDYSGSDSFSYRVSDGTVESNTATVSLTIMPLNHAPVPPTNQAPVAQDVSVTLAEDTSASVTPAARDADVGDHLTYTVVTEPQHGSVLVASGTFRYTPDADYNGPDSFTYRANDGTVDSNTATVSLTVTPVNDAPALDLDTNGAGSGFEITSSGGATAVTGIVGITDPDTGAAIASATISVTSNGATDTLDVLTLDQTTQDTYHVVFSGGPGTYTLSAAPGATVSDADFAAAIQALSLNVADTAADHDLQVSIQVDDGTAGSNAAVATVHVLGNGSDEPPVVDLNGSAAGVDTANYDPQVMKGEVQRSSHILGGQVSVSDVHGTIDHATVTLSTYQPGDQLDVDVSALGGTVSASYDQGLHILTLTNAGDATLADFQAALDGVSLSNLPIGPGQRVLQVTVNDGSLDSATATATVVFQSPFDLNRTYQDDGSSGYATAASATAGAQTYVTGNVAIADLGTPLDHATFTITDMDGTGSDTLTISADVLAVHHLTLSGSSGTYQLHASDDGMPGVADYVEAINAATFSTGDLATRNVTIDVSLTLSDATTPYNVGTSTIAVGASPGGQFGYALASVGDIDGDGFDDFAASSPGSSSVGVSLSTQRSAGLNVVGSGAGDLFGYALASTGDVNGDHTPDFIVGAPNAAASGGGVTHPGAAYVVFARYDQGSSTTIDAAHGTDGFAIQGAADGDQAGHAVASAGYVDDGTVPDVLVGAPGANGGAGAAYLVYGKSDTGVIQLGSLTASQGIVVAGAAIGDHAGFAVAGGGDVNRDGHADFIVGAPDAGGGAGAAYLIYGANGLGDISLGASTGYGLAITGAAVGNHAGYGLAITGAAVGDHAGYAVANVGDVNGDGYDDFAIGAPDASFNGRAEAGAVYVIYGGARPENSGFNLADLDATQGFVVGGAAAGDHLGSTIAAAGDLDGDGYADFLVGAPDASIGGRAQNGDGFAVHGSASPTTVDAASLSVINFGGDRNGSHIGDSLASTGDNGSGVLDIAAGAPRSPSGYAVNDGYYVTTGGGGLVGGAVQGTPGNETLEGNAGSQPIDGQQGNDRIIGHGGQDYLIGGAGQDTFVFDSADAAGRSTIADFHPATTLTDGAGDTRHDTIEIDGYTAYAGSAADAFAALTSHATQVNSHDTLIVLDPAASAADQHTILLKNVLLSSLAADDFTFHQSQPSA